MILKEHTRFGVSHRVSPVDVYVTQSNVLSWGSNFLGLEKYDLLFIRTVNKVSICNIDRRFRDSFGRGRRPSPVIDRRFRQRICSKKLLYHTLFLLVTVTSVLYVCTFSESLLKKGCYRYSDISKVCHHRGPLKRV